MVDLMFFLVWCMWPLNVSIYGARSLLIGSIVKLVRAVKYPFLIAWMRVWLAALISVAWYHCDRSGFVLSAIKLFSDWHASVGIGCGVVARCTFHVPAAPWWVPSRINHCFFSTIMFMAVNMDVQPSSHSFPMYISAPYCRWGRCVLLFPLWITRS